MSVAVDYQGRLDAAIDDVLDALDDSAAAGVELDPLATIMGRLRERGAELDLSAAPPMMQMLLGGILG